MSPLERHCRWLLRAYPAWYRRDRAEEMLGTLLEASPPGEVAFLPRRAGPGDRGPAGPRLDLAAVDDVGGDRGWRSYLCHCRVQSPWLRRGLAHPSDDSMARGATGDYRCGRDSRGGMGAAVSSTAGRRVRPAPWLAAAQLAPGSWLGWFVGGGLGAYDPGRGVGGCRGGRHPRRSERRRDGHLRRVAGARGRDDPDTGRASSTPCPMRARQDGHRRVARVSHGTHRTTYRSSKLLVRVRFPSPASFARFPRPLNPARPSVTAHSEGIRRPSVKRPDRPARQ